MFTPQIARVTSLATRFLGAALLVFVGADHYYEYSAAVTPSCRRSERSFS